MAVFLDRQTELALGTAEILPLLCNAGRASPREPVGPRESRESQSGSVKCSVESSGAVGEGECVGYGWFADDVAGKQGADGEFEFVGGFDVFRVVERFDV